jgi:mono/diheme cytochrome c family protein
MSRLSIRVEITIGVLLTLITGIILVWYGVGEEERMGQFKAEQKARSIEVGATLFENNCSGCHGADGKGVPGIWPPLNDSHFFQDRLKAIGWSGTLEDYIVATISSGRLVSTRPDQYPGGEKPVMAAFSDKFGGPLREDQIRNIAAFVMNWESTAQPVGGITQEPGPPAGTDITIELPAGDPQRGSALVVAMGCTVCHVTTPTGPAWPVTPEQPGIGERATTRFTQADYSGSATTPEQYLFESIVLPGVYVVQPFTPLMPQNYSETLTAQTVADIIAYLLTIK